MWKIGNIKILSNVVIAPMAGISNFAFRSVMRKFGAELLYSEMINDKFIYFNGLKIFNKFYFGNKEHLLNIQIFGNDINTLCYAAKFIEKNTCASFIDINMGCPVKKIVKNGSGSKLLLYPEKIFKILDSVVNSVKIPVTVKMRLGWNNSENIFKNVLAAEKAGVSAICIHGRTRNQMFKGKINLDILKDIKKILTIPLIINGNIKTLFDVKYVLNYTNADAIMIGRGILGNPWLIKQINSYFINNIFIKNNPTILEKIDNIKFYLSKLIDLKGEKIAMKEIKKVLYFYLKNIKNISKIRFKLNKCFFYKELILLLETLI